MDAVVAPGRWMLVARRGHAKHRARALATPSGSRTARWVAATTAVLVLGGWWTWSTVGGTDPASDVTNPLARSEADQSDVPRHHVLTTFVGDERARVVERLSFTRPPEVLVVSNPVRTGSAAGLVPTVLDLWLDDGSGPRPIGDPPPPGESVTVALPTSPEVVRIGYLVSGVVARSEPSAAGRALALATPLHVSPAGARTVELRGPEVDNLGCLTGTGRLTVCGSLSDAGWSVRIETGTTDVLAQLTFPVG